MGGIAILVAAVLGYLVSHVRAGVVFSDQTLIALTGVVALAAVGLVDDLIKVSRRRNRGPRAPPGCAARRRSGAHGGGQSLLATAGPQRR